MAKTFFETEPDHIQTVGSGCDLGDVFSYYELGEAWS
jgi:hypothetical protein